MNERRYAMRALRFWPGLRTRAGLLLIAGLTLASAWQPKSRAEPAGLGSAPILDGQLSVMTYNVKGLPWPIASGRDQALARIGQRLAAMRRQGRQPGVVVLQEAFTDQAKAIGDAAGYAWQVQGPYARAEPGNAKGGSWFYGETQAAMLDSGLAVFSDYPVIAVERAGFSPGDCAGFDCLAAKGVLMVTINVPGTGPVTVAATHLNSRKASGVSFFRANAAYARQAAFLGRMLRERRNAPEPLIVAGDFNRGNRPSRIAALDAALGRTGEALISLARTGRLVGAQQSDFDTIRERGRDMQFVSNGHSLNIEPVDAEVPFGTEPDGTTLSDHLGYVVRYRLTPTASRPVRLAANTR